MNNRKYFWKWVYTKEAAHLRHDEVALRAEQDMNAVADGGSLANEETALT